MSMTMQIDGLSGCLETFGKVLAQNAIDSLDPLHVPNRNLINHFEHVPDERYPFEPQAHVIEAARKMLNESNYGFIIGEMGCIAGESEVYDPVAKVYRRVAHRWG